MEDVATCKQRAVEAMERFLRVLRKVPEDKLTWSPASTAKSALQIAAHCAGYSAAFAVVIRDGRVASTDEFLRPVNARTASVATLEQAESMLRQGIAETLEALDTVTPSRALGQVETPQGPVPFSFFMNLPAQHLYGHTYQIDYLQTCWGDQEVHL